jgi:hypothetical protein
MHISKRSFRHFNAICAGLALLLCSGCITMPVSTYTNVVAYEPVRSPVQIDASAAVDAVDTISPENRAIWKHYLNNDASITNYANALEQVLRNDLATSGLFARIVTDGTTKADYVVKAECLESHPADFRVRIALTATETATGLQVSSHTREVSLGTSVFDVKLNEALPGLMAALKADLVADFQAKTRRQQEQVAREEADLFTKASLSDLLAGSDKSESLARARNRALIAAKNQQLPAILRERKTDELAALVVKIEQTILDLDHECEVAKDQAQQSVAAGGSATESTRSGRGRGAAGPTENTPNLDELRSLAISYRERIELLKPILSALKDEIANRSR